MLAKINSHGGTTIDWCSVDSQQAYNQNSIIEGPQWEYASKKVSYSLNEYGYRTENLDKINWKESVVIIGDGNVFGIGINESDTMCSLLSKKINKPVINLGVPASSHQLMLYNSINLLDNKIKPLAVILLFADPTRYTHFNSEANFIIPLGQWILQNSTIQHTVRLSKSKAMTDFYTTYMQDNNAEEYGIMSAISTEAVWKAANVATLSYASYFSAMSNRFKCLLERVDRSRDLNHPGILTNLLWTEEIYKDLTKVL
jgi:hypothetical protein